jgi:hypothetical protein
MYEKHAQVQEASQSVEYMAWATTENYELTSHPGHGGLSFSGMRR